MKIGIDKLAFYVPNLYIELKDLAQERNVDPNKYHQGLMQYLMSVSHQKEDIITMGANAACQIVNQSNINDIDLIMVATETSVDESKSAATFIHSLLNLKKEARAIEIKQACYSATAALYFAKGHILQSPNSKVLIIASDIARYKLNSEGEPTQGAGAVAFIVSKNPKIAVVDIKQSVYTEDIYDFFRPNNLKWALVSGHYSNSKYQEFFLNVVNSYLNQTKLTLDDFQGLCFHIPYSKIGLKSINLLTSPFNRPDLFDNYQLSIKYNQIVGNIYTGSLYLSIISLLENGNLDPEARIGCFSYGSGAVGEFFSIVLEKDYKKHLNQENHLKMLNSRIKIDIKTYEQIANDQSLTPKDHGPFEKFILEDIIDHKRIYKKRG